ncbi:Formylglycine-generating enzyme, required for sulfatase activity, contains SUMF1/FGE domain [Amphibacillus marinus]|uniref:Formylglycine-generating enzyme, required for sulfatase activity, contains SUMF1/FGE domain n=1 Tax=Amphibacillus marinus TaxID=872970 RepID=A0A1H8TGE8_9BACI|nr:formylglycine-generating enzyme family protein [Amphibacillus marinus]SEO89684.1 Formylglycine-generating enzyme, required for sulfatase activity, contains SUMF1/FGE domain [Amphibacillus marinus]
MDDPIKTCCHASRQIGNVDATDMEESLITQSNSTKFSDKLIPIQAGKFIMGTNDLDGFPEDGEGPPHEEVVDSFLMDSYTVTNQEFANFIEATGYQTDAEKYGWSFVFDALVQDKNSPSTRKLPGLAWWYAVMNAYWYQPEGEGSSIENRLDHPVVHVSWNDAQAFAHWANKRLPSEKEWEYAARGGLAQKRYPWGDALTPGGEHYCNIWQGEFPYHNTEADGYLATAPAKSFPPNGYGLYNMSGNVWEWCIDSFTIKGKRDLRRKNSRVTRGGSYLCHHSYCNRYRVAARTSNTIDSSSSNIGFRCVKDI